MSYESNPGNLSCAVTMSLTVQSNPVITDTTDWDQKKCPYYGVSLLSGINVRKMYGAVPRNFIKLTPYNGEEHTTERDSN